MEENMKVKIFIDFWNLQISWNRYHNKLGAEKVSLPWGDKLRTVLLSKLVDNVEYSGTHLYASINPQNPKDKYLKGFLNNLNMCEGYKVIVKERKSSKPIFCNKCNHDILNCPTCNEKLTRTIEKGVDTTIAIELFQFAVDNLYDTAILISGDADFIPAIDYIQQKGKKIIHAGWKDIAYNISMTCWSRIYFEDIMVDLLQS